MIIIVINVIPNPMPICAERVAGESPKKKPFISFHYKKIYILPGTAVTGTVLVVVVVLRFCVV
jgi:hypothetical protein